MSRTVAWRGETPVTEEDIAFQILTTGGEDLPETVYLYLLRRELAQLARAEGVTVDPAAVEARLAALRDHEGFEATLLALGMDLARFADELAEEELVSGWMEREEAVTDDHADSLYEREFRGALKPGAIRARHILLDDADRDEARRRIERIAAEEAPFASKAERYSVCPSAANGGDLGWLREDLVIDGFRALFDEESGAGPKVVESELGLHLVEVTDRQAAAPLSEAEGRAEARRKLAEMVRKERLAQILQRIRLETRFAEETN